MPYIIQKRVSFIEKRTINAFHAQLYHGRASRDGKPYPKFPDYRFSDTHETKGLDLVRSLIESPSITIPSLNWVVDESGKRAMQDTPRVRFLRCESLITYPLSFAYLNSFTNGYKIPMRPAELHERALNILGMTKSSASRWEVLVPRGSELASNGADVNLQWTLYEDDEPVELAVFATDLEKTPFFIHEGAYVLGESFFERISEYLNEPYFFIDHIRV